LRAIKTRKKTLLSILLVIVLIIAGILVYLFETRTNESTFTENQSEGILNQGAPPQFYPNGSYPPVPIVWTITLTQNFSNLPIGTKMYLLTTNTSLTGLGYSAYSYFVKDLSAISPKGSDFSDGDKVGINGQIVTSKDINGNEFLGFYGTLNYTLAR
jgi:hypothetical protein